jgi:hypothetical protein
MIFKSYKDMFAPLNASFPADAIVQSVIDLLVIDVDTPVLVLERFALVISCLIQIWADRHYCSPIPNRFHTFVDFLRELMSRPIETAEDMSMFDTACDALNQLILHGCEQGQIADLQELFRTTLSELEASHTLVEADHIRFSIQARLSSTLMSLALRIGLKLQDDELHQAVEYLFGLLEQRDSLIYEEALPTLTSLYISLNKHFTRDEVDHMMLIVHDALGSECPGVISSASVLLGDLFHFSGADLIDKFDDCWVLAGSLLREHEDMREIHPFVIRALAEMFEGIVDAGVDRLVSYAPDLFELMKMVRGVPIDPESHSDVQYADTLFGFLAQLYRVFAKLFCPELSGITGRGVSPRHEQLLVQERVYLSEMAEFAKAVAVIKNPSDMLLSHFLEMAIQFAQKCSIRNNAVLNRQAVHIVLEMTQRTDKQMHLKQRGQSAQIFLRKR